MGGDLNTENSRKLTNKEEAYISANPDLYVERIYYEDLNNPNPNSNKYRPYKLEDLPPEKHIEAGYCDEPGLHYVPLDIYPKRTHILRFGPEDILFYPKKAIKNTRRDYSNTHVDREIDSHLKELYKHHPNLFRGYGDYPSPDVD